MRKTTLNEHEKAVNRVIDYINGHLYEMPGMVELSEIANISGFYLHRIFKAIIGENIGEFINRLRMEDVALRLQMGSESLSDIAFKTGYATKHALSRAFKNHFGISPSVYRNNPKNIHPFFGCEKRTAQELIPEIRHIEIKEIVYIRIIDVYGAHESFVNAWKKLGEFASRKKLTDKSTEFIGLSFDDPSITPPSRCRFYACFTPNQKVEPEGPFGVRRINGGTYAVFTHKGAYYKLKDTYYNIYVNWMSKAEYKLKGSLSFEKYLNSPTNVKEEDLLTEIYVPISK